MESVCDKQKSLEESVNHSITLKETVDDSITYEEMIKGLLVHFDNNKESVVIEDVIALMDRCNNLRVLW